LQRAAKLRAYFPGALYIGYQDDLSQRYGDYHAEQKTERRKLGMTTGERAKDLQVNLLEFEEGSDSYEEDSDSTESPGYLVPDDSREAVLGIDLNNIHL
jgi:hypothetical protein